MRQKARRGARKVEKPPQFPPGLYDFLRGDNNSRIARMLSLSTTLPTAPPVTWKKKNEHWFTPAGLDLSTALNVTSIKVQYVSDLTNLTTIAQALAVGANFTFQKYAKGVLASTDWVAGAPSWSAPAYYFEESAANDAMRPLFQVLSTDHTKFHKIGWVTLDNTVTQYMSGVPAGTIVTVSSVSTANIPNNGSYYQT